MPKTTNDENQPHTRARAKDDGKNPPKPAGRLRRNIMVNQDELQALRAELSEASKSTKSSRQMEEVLKVLNNAKDMGAKLTSFLSNAANQRNHSAAVALLLKPENTKIFESLASTADELAKELHSYDMTNPSTQTHRNIMLKTDRLVKVLMDFALLSHEYNLEENLASDKNGFTEAEIDLLSNAFEKSMQPYQINALITGQVSTRLPLLYRELIKDMSSLRELTSAEQLQHTEHFTQAMHQYYTTATDLMNNPTYFELTRLDPRETRTYNDEDLSRLKAYVENLQNFAPNLLSDPENDLVQARKIENNEINFDEEKYKNSNDAAAHFYEKVLFNSLVAPSRSELKNGSKCMLNDHTCEQFILICKDILPRLDKQTHEQIDRTIRAIGSQQNEINDLIAAGKLNTKEQETLKGKIRSLENTKTGLYEVAAPHIKQQFFNDSKANASIFEYDVKRQVTQIPRKMLNQKRDAIIAQENPTTRPRP